MFVAKTQHGSAVSNLTIHADHHYIVLIIE